MIKQLQILKIIAISVIPQDALDEFGKDYNIAFETAASLNNFQLYYKNKLVDVKYRIDSKGKIAFLNNKNKLSCISYADGSKMSTLTKYKVVNYFAKCLHDRNIMSDEVTTSFEKI